MWTMRGQIGGLLVEKVGKTAQGQGKHSPIQQQANVRGKKIVVKQREYNHGRADCEKKWPEFFLLCTVRSKKIRDKPRQRAQNKKEQQKSDSAKLNQEKNNSVVYWLIRPSGAGRVKRNERAGVIACASAKPKNR